jgi:hypothetical protein
MCVLGLGGCGESSSRRCNLQWLAYRSEIGRRLPTRLNDQCGLFGRDLPPAGVPGEFHALPVLGHAMYVPEIRCNGAELRVKVADGN